MSIFPGISCDLVVPQGSEHIITGEEAGDVCGGRDFFSVPSQDGIPFQLLVDFPSRQRTDPGTVYTSRTLANFKTPVLIAYNLFTLRADRVTFEKNTHTLEASGNVVTFNEKGKAEFTNMVQTAESMTFRIENGEATRLP